jgi:hypothetical protein
MESMSDEHFILSGATKGDHIAQAYQTVDQLVETAGLFLGIGLRRGDPALVIATKLHWDQCAQFLKDAGLDVDDAIRTGLLTVFDADEILKGFMAPDGPDETKFRASVGAVMVRICHEAPRGTKLRAYGELVDLLCSRDDLESALRLEAFWNALSKELPFSLLCSYRADPDNVTTREMIRSVGELHSHLIAH